MMADFLLNLLASFAYDLLKALPSRFQDQRNAPCDPSLAVAQVFDLRGQVGDLSHNTAANSPAG